MIIQENELRKAASMQADKWLSDEEQNIIEHNFSDDFLQNTIQKAEIESSKDLVFPKVQRLLLGMSALVAACILLFVLKQIITGISNPDINEPTKPITLSPSEESDWEEIIRGSSDYTTTTGVEDFNSLLKLSTCVVIADVISSEYVNSAAREVKLEVKNELAGNCSNTIILYQNKQNKVLNTGSTYIFFLGALKSDSTDGVKYLSAYGDAGIMLLDISNKTIKVQDRKIQDANFIEWINEKLEADYVLVD